MTDARLESCAQGLLRANDAVAIRTAYGSWLDTLLTSGMWSSSSPSGLMIPWRSFRDAAKSKSLCHTCASFGLYIFVTTLGMPRYIGKADRQSLRKRLGGRYLNRSKGQLQLAADISQGFGVPDELKNDSFYRSRIRGAEDFALHGIEGIWIGLLPIEDRARVSEAECKLVPVANKVNLDSQMKPLVNVQLLSGVKL